MKHLIDWKDWDSQTLRQLLADASDIKKNPQKYASSLKGKNTLLFFEKTSTRTRISFAAATNQLGGNAIIVDPMQSQAQKTKLTYEVGSMSGYCDFIVARLKYHKELVDISRVSNVPIINGCCNLYHPCQTLADLLTMWEYKNDLKNVKLVYVGVHNNVANSLVSMANHFHFQLCLVCPISPAQSVDEKEKEKAQKNNLLTQTTHLSEALKQADFVYTDTWLDMEFFLDDTKKALLEERKKVMMPYQLNKETLQNFQGKIMHDMPIHEGYEITDDLVYAKNSIIFQQSENRLYAQKAILNYFNNQ
jgi:ornithine carbamoyltransferase